MCIAEVQAIEEELKIQCPIYQALGSCRHLCESRCYYFFFEPRRQEAEIVARLQAAGQETSFHGWQVGLQRKLIQKTADASPASSWAVFFQDPFGTRYTSIEATMAALLKSHSMINSNSGQSCKAEDGKPFRQDDCINDNRLKAHTRKRPSTAHLLEQKVPKLAARGARSPFFRTSNLSSSPYFIRRSVWTPLDSPYGLLEELLWEDPWRLLVGCILLNQTHRRNVDPVIFRLFRRYPDALAMSMADAACIETIIAPLGLHRRRSRTLITMSSMYNVGTWRRPEELPGCGEYAAEAYRLFVTGTWRESLTKDRVLRMYRSFLESVHRGEHSGVDAEQAAPMMHVSSAKDYDLKKERI